MPSPLDDEQLRAPNLTVGGLSRIEPPVWMRIEPKPIGGEPSPGLEMAVQDPLWALGRQWQFGEFAGEDAGTPLGVTVEFTARGVTAWQPGDPASGRPERPLDRDAPLEPIVEAEATPPGGPGWRARAEAGHVLVRALAAAGHDVRAALLAAYPLVVDPASPGPWRVLARAHPDGEQVARALEAAPDAAPAWLAAGPPAAVAAARRWHAWYRSSVAPRDRDDAWVAERLEYRFSIRVGDPRDPQVMVAPMYDGGTIDWHSFEVDPARTPAIARGLAPDSDAARTTRSLLATPLRYPGMPVDRLWQFEDGAVNLAMLDVQAHDLARLCFVEYAMVHGNDWYCAPLDVPAGSFVVVTSVHYTTTFGDRIAVERGGGGGFRMFETSILGTDRTVPGLFVPPSARGTLEGRALEEVALLRDEAANLAWAVEKTVQAASGDPRERAEEPRPTASSAPRLAGTDLQYRLATTVPAHWIPLVPTPVRHSGAFVLRKGTVTGADESRGVLLRSPPSQPLDIADCEVPREGVRVRRVPAMVRGGGGERLRWVARRVGVGRGEGSSRLRFDEASDD